MITHLLTIPTTIRLRSRAGAADRFGTPAWELGDPTEALCWIHPAGTEELAGREVGTVTHIAYFDPDAVLDTFARVTVDGIAHEVISPPELWRHPINGAAFIRVELRAGAAEDLELVEVPGS